MESCFPYIAFIILITVWRLNASISSVTTSHLIVNEGNDRTTQGTHDQTSTASTKSSKSDRASSSWDQLRPFENANLSGTRVTDCSPFISAEAYVVMSATQRAIDNASPVSRTPPHSKPGDAGASNGERVLFNKTIQSEAVEEAEPTTFAVPTRFLYRCLQALGADYIPFESPFGLQTNPVLTLSIALNEVVELTFDGTLGLKLTLEYWWRDPRLQWFRGSNLSRWLWAEYVVVPARMLWRPDVQVLNCQNDCVVRIGENESVTLYNSGQVAAWKTAFVQSRCALDLSYYPFDNQTCELHMWLLNEVLGKYEVRVSNASVPVQYMARSDEWIVTALESVSTDIDIRFLSEERPDRWRVQHVNWGKGAVRMRVSLRRTSGFYVYNLLVPLLVVSSLGLFSVLLPPESEKRSAILLTNVYTFIILESVVANSAPKTDTMPLIGAYIICALALVTLHLLGTYIVLVLAAHAESDAAADPRRSESDGANDTDGRPDRLQQSAYCTHGIASTVAPRSKKPPLALRATIVWPMRTSKRALTALLQLFYLKCKRKLKARKTHDSVHMNTQVASEFDKQQQVEDSCNQTKQLGNMIDNGGGTELPLIDLSVSTFPQMSGNDADPVMRIREKVSRSVNYVSSRESENSLTVHLKAHAELRYMDSSNSSDHLDRHSSDHQLSGATHVSNEDYMFNSAAGPNMLIREQQPNRMQDKITAAETSVANTRHTAEESWAELAFYLNLQLCSIYLILNAAIFIVYLVPLLDAWASNARSSVYYYEAGAILNGSDDASAS